MEKKLPKGWVETELREVVWSSKGKKPKRLEEYDFEGALPYLDILALEKGIIRQYADVNSSKVFSDNDIAIVWDGARSGWIFKTRKGVIGSTLCAISPKGFNVDFLYYYLLKEHQGININARGVGIPHVDPTYLWSLKFNLPPLAEQERIANKLDELFARVEVIKKSMDKIPQLLKDFRQQVLTSAVTGKLTEEWREGKDLEEWKECKVNDVLLDKPRNGFSPKAVEYITEVKSLALSATTSGRFNPVYVKYLDIPKPQKDSHLWLMKGDILVQRSNSLEYVGTSAIYDGENYDFIYPDIMMKLRVNTLIFNKMLYYILSCNKTKEYFRLNASGTAGNMPKINQKIISDLLFLLPSLIEQEEIIKRVESLFIKADQIEEQYKALKEKIDILPQLLLHKAFKGELVEQLPTDGDAAELLKEIMALKKK
ncbi:MAG: restriction endonuclease subunit S [Flavobacteriaceae bacterium]|jgi:type I restriction enzyme S subunit|nr:restriction endonuclease subunit S [Flavobacteriaceae bacterium]